MSADFIAAARDLFGPKPTAPAPVAYLPAGTGTGYAGRALEAEVQRVMDCPPHDGGGRNDALNTAAYSLGQLVGGGALSEGEVVAALTAAARAVNLPESEIASILPRCVHEGAEKPRGVPERPAPSPLGLPVLTPPTIVPPVDEAQPEGEGDQRTSWWPQDLAAIISGDYVPEAAPAFLARQDGHRMFYAGKINALIGESESGKTWIALLAVVQALTVGERVLYLDFEDTAPGIVARLRLMGVTAAQLGGLAYIGPEQTLDSVARLDLGEHLGEHKPALIVLDGVNAAMTMLGLDLEKNKDATYFTISLLKPLKRTGAAVVTIDHVTKNKETRGSYAIGAQAKKADVDGCAIAVEVTQPFGKGMAGAMKLTVFKDRPGQVRGVCGGGKAAGVAHLDSTDPAITRCWIEGPDLRSAEERGPWRPTVLMKRISDFLQLVPGDELGPSQTVIEREVQGNADDLRKALTVLVDEGYVARQVRGKGSAHRLIRGFVDDSDQGLGPVLSGYPVPRPNPVLTPSSDGVATPSSRPPSSRGTGDGVDIHAQEPM